MAARRTILRVKVGVDNRPVASVKFPADRWHIYDLDVAAGESQLQILDIPTATQSQKFIVALRSTVEGVQWWKVSSVAPTVNTDPELPKRELRPFEITDDREWGYTLAGNASVVPAVVVYNPTAKGAKVKIFYATREDGSSITGYDVGDVVLADEPF